METFTGLGFMLGPPLGGVLYSVSNKFILCFWTFLFFDDALSSFHPPSSCLHICVAYSSSLFFLGWRI